jgi:hypothetical protein
MNDTPPGCETSLGVGVKTFVGSMVGVASGVTTVCVGGTIVNVGAMNVALGSAVSYDGRDGVLIIDSRVGATPSPHVAKVESAVMIIKNIKILILMQNSPICRYQ